MSEGSFICSGNLISWMKNAMFSRDYDVSETSGAGWLIFVGALLRDSWPLQA